MLSIELIKKMNDFLDNHVSKIKFHMIDHKPHYYITGTDKQTICISGFDNKKHSSIHNVCEFIKKCLLASTIQVKIHCKIITLKIIDDYTIIFITTFGIFKGVSITPYPFISEYSPTEFIIYEDCNTQTYLLIENESNKSFEQIYFIDKKEDIIEYFI